MTTALLTRPAPPSAASLRVDFTRAELIAAQRFANTARQHVAAVAQAQAAPTVNTLARLASLFPSIFTDPDALRSAPPTTQITAIRPLVPLAVYLATQLAELAPPRLQLTLAGPAAELAPSLLLLGADLLRAAQDLTHDTAVAALTIHSKLKPDIP